MVREQRGELGEPRSFETKHGRAEFAAYDRLQITGTDKARGYTNGATGTVLGISDNKLVVALDGRGNRAVEIDATEFKDFRHGYAGTIYKGQGRTLDQTYLYHSEHWRSASSYVALTRHRDKAELFVARNTAPDLKHLARQMARVDDRRAASHFYHNYDPGPVRPLTPRELAAKFATPDPRAHHERQEPKQRDQTRSASGRGNVSDHTSAKDSRQARLDRLNDTRDFGDGHNRDRTHGPRGRPRSR